MITKRKMKKEDLSKEGLLKIIKRDVTEINSLSDDDLISIISLFKYLATPNQDDEQMVFATNRTSIVGLNKDSINEKFKDKYNIIFIDEINKEIKTKERGVAS